MRESLLGNFHTIWIDNLHGNRLASERTPWGDSCETIFNIPGGGPGIKVGTCISTLLKRKEAKTKPEATLVFARDFWGRAHLKRQALLASLKFDELPEEERRKLAELPQGPREYHPVMPTEKNRWKLVPTSATGGFEEWPGLDELFVTQFHGVNTNRGLDGGVIEMDKEDLVARMKEYFSSVSHEEFAARHPGLATGRSRYEFRKVRDRLRRESAFDPQKIQPYVQFPLDKRWIYYELEAKLLSEPGPEFARNLRDNRFLVAVPQPRRPSEQRPMLLSSLFALHVHDRGAKAFAVHTTPEDGPKNLFSEESRTAREPAANLESAVWEKLKKTWHLGGDLRGDEAKKLVLDLFHLTLAIAHAPQYQLDHQDALAHDWIHLPIPKPRKALKEIARLGETVATLLDPMADPARALQDLLGADRRTLAVPSSREQSMLRDQDLIITISSYGAARGGWRERVPREKEASHPAWGETTGDLYLNDTVYLANVPERVWRYELGGYPVLKKWLGYRDQKRRPGRPLTADELDHLRSMVHRIAALLLLHDRLDKAYEQAIEDPFTTEELGL
ncbi:MAG TPA: type ISP restriction/modification enzyme [Thermoanaerobaculia bacterium]|nr:type ISP restriction/modification enzyme [Thermoanaerobaculia bacterium]